MNDMSFYMPIDGNTMNISSFNNIYLLKFECDIKRLKSLKSSYHRHNGHNDENDVTVFRFTNFQFNNQLANINRKE